MTTTRRLAAILAADVAGYSRLMAADEVGTLAALKAARREVVDPQVAAHNGRIVKTTGDGMLVEFASAVDAVTCAMAVQEAMAGRGGAIVFRIGINVGDIIIDGDDIFGDGVNVAARVENECAPGRVALSANAFEQVRNKTAFGFDDLGERALKNIDRPVRIYAIRSHATASVAGTTAEPEKQLPLPDKPSIAVLPFQNMSGDPEQEYFADGMVEDIITALSRFKSLFVIARNSSFTYKGRAVDIKQVGLELGVRYVLEGSVRKAGGRVRITGQLIEAASGVHLWADHFDGALEDVFDLQDNVAESVVSTIFAEVQRAEIALSRHKPTDRLDAYDCFLRSIASTRPGDREVNDVALRWAYKAIELDPEFGAAYARAAQCYSNRKQSRWMKHVPTESAEGVRLARLAIQYAGNDATALAHAGMVIGYVGGEVEEGLLYTERAISLNSNSDRAWVSSGWLNLYLGNHETSIAHIAKALRLSPRAPERAQWLNAAGFANLFSGNLAEAARLAGEAHRLSATLLSALRVLASANALSGEIEQARTFGRRILEIDPAFRLAGIKELIPLRRPEDLQTYIDGMRLSGIPE